MKTGYLLLALGATMILEAVTLSSARADNNNVQMLPPTIYGSTSPCVIGSNQLLIYAGSGTNGSSAINCIATLGINPVNGNFGIGTATPAAMLDVNGNAIVRGQLTVGGPLNIYNNGSDFIPIEGISQTSREGVYGFGGLYGVHGESENGWGGFFRSQISYGVEASTTAGNAALYAENQGSGCFVYLATDTQAAVQSNCAAFSSSDARLKKDVRPLADGLAMINGLKPVSFLWKDDRKNRSLIDDGDHKAANFGFIAQDVQKTLPDLVNTLTMPDDKQLPKDEPKTTLSLNYEGFIAPLVKAVQELYAQVTESKQRIAVLADKQDAQAAEIAALKAEIAALKAAH